MWNTQVRTKSSGNKTALSYSKFKDYRKRIAYFPGYSKDPLKGSTLPTASKFKPAPVEEVITPESELPAPETPSTEITE